MTANHVETVQAIYQAFGRGFHCIDRHAVVLAYGL